MNQRQPPTEVNGSQKHILEENAHCLAQSPQPEGEWRTKRSLVVMKMAEFKAFRH